LPLWPTESTWLLLVLLLLLEVQALRVLWLLSLEGLLVAELPPMLLQMI